MIPCGAIHPSVVENAKVPVIETGTGNCHIFVAASADLDTAEALLINAKTQWPGVCNAVETLLVHEAVAEEFLPRAAQALTDRGVTLRGCERARQIVPAMEPATEEDWATEYLDLILAVRVPSFGAAVEHISGMDGHSEAIVTRDHREAERFTQCVDAAVVYERLDTLYGWRAIRAWR